MTTDPLDPDDPLGGGGAPAPGTAPPPPPPPAGPQRRLIRRHDDRMIWGVASGLADYLAIDPLLVRIGFVALSFAGGAGIALYVAGGLLIPTADGTTVIDRLRQRHPRWGSVAAVVALIVAVGLLVNSLDIAHAGFIWGVILVAVGIMLLVEEGWQPFRWPATGPDAGYRPPPWPTYAFTAAPQAQPYFPAAVAPAPPAPAWTVQPRRPRSFLGLATLAVALLTIGVAALLDDLGAVALSAEAAFALMLLVIGAGLLVGTWFGHSRGLIVLGVLLIPFAAAAALVHEPLDAGAGERTAAPQTLSGVASDYRLTAGHLRVDVSQVPFDGTSPSVTMQVALGQLEVIVPATVAVDITGHVGAGELDLLGRIVSGVDIDAHVTSPGAAGGGTLHLDLHEGFGQVRVVRAGG